MTQKHWSDFEKMKPVEEMGLVESLMEMHAMEDISGGVDEVMCRAITHDEWDVWEGGQWDHPAVERYCALSDRVLHLCRNKPRLSLRFDASSDTTVTPRLELDGHITNMNLVAIVALLASGLTTGAPGDYPPQVVNAAQGFIAILHDTLGAKDLYRMEGENPE